MATFGTSDNTAPGQSEYLNPVVPSQVSAPVYPVSPGQTIDTSISSTIQDLVAKDTGCESPDSYCDEKHNLSTVFNESVLTLQSAVTGGVAKTLLSACPAQVFDVTIQTDTTANIQIFDGGYAVSGNFQVLAGGLLIWRGRYITNVLNVVVSNNANIIVEVRYRSYTP